MILLILIITDFDFLGGAIFLKHNSLGEALRIAYPDYEWDLSKFSSRGKKSSQRWLYVKLKKLIPHTKIEEEYFHPDLSWEGIENKMERKKKNNEY